MKFKNFIATILLVTGCCQANASIITVDGNNVGAYQIGSNDWAGFYESNIKHQLDNQFAITGELVLFIAQAINGDFGVVSIFNERNNGVSSVYGSSLTVDVVSSEGNLVYEDGEDGGEYPTFTWATDYSDGFIWSNLSSDSWFTDISFTDISNSDLTAFTVLTSDGTDLKELYSSDLTGLTSLTTSISTISVDSPQNTFIFLTGLMLIAFRLKRT